MSESTDNFVSRIKAPLEEEDKKHTVDFDDGDGGTLKVIEYTPGEYHHSMAGMYRRLCTLSDFQVRPDDVWIIGYPKSGTHWLWDPIHMLMNDTLTPPDMVKESGFMPFRELETLENIASPRLLNSHLTLARFPSKVLEAGCKIILVIRNPKDVAVSYFNHYKARDVHDGKWSGFYNLYSKGRVPFDSWFDNVLPWWQYAKTKTNIIVVKYEDMKKDLPKEVNRLSEFLGKETSGVRCKLIAEKCHFKAMKERKSKMSNAADTAFAYRKGEVGDWKNWFTVAQNEMYDDIYREKMKNSDLETDFTIVQTL